jgi:hypothetical protein
MTCDFRWIVSSIAHLPDEACTTSAQGSKLPLRRGGEAGQRALGVLMNFPVVSVRLCGLKCYPVTTSVQLKMSNRDFSKTAGRNTYF